MKKQLVLALMAVVISISSLQAQGGGQRQTPEERTRAIMEKLAVLNLDTAAHAKTTVVISEFTTSQQNAMQEMRASGNMDREAMMAKRKELADARDLKLKAIFTEAQMKRWIEEIEPSIRTQRRNAQ